MPSNCEGMLQMAKGLHYIHSNNFVHRDIKPSNVLISKNEPVRLMIADFGLCKATTNCGSFSMGSGNKGTEGWMAPEIIGSSYTDDYDYDNQQPLKRFSIASDIWALGCLFFYFLTKGIHPFGKNFRKIRRNILVDGIPVEIDGKFARRNVI
jgi:serine/threonine protein kinase